MQYKSTKNKIYKTWVKTIASKEEISKLKQSQDRLTKKARILEVNYMKKANHYESDWQTMDYSVEDRYITSFIISLQNIPIVKLPYIYTNIIFKGTQELIDDLQRFDNLNAIKINTFFLMHEGTVNPNIITGSYNINLFVGLEINNDTYNVRPATYTQLQARVVVRVN